MYKITTASINKRLFSHIIDLLIISIISSIVIFFGIKDELLKYKESKKYNEINIEIKEKDNKLETIIKKEDLAILENKNTIEDKSKDEYAFIKTSISKNKKLHYLIISINFLYYIFFFFTNKQATFGQQIFDLMLIREDGSRLTFYDCINRVCVFYFLQITSFTVLFSKKKETLYDIISKTKVIEIK